MKTSTINLGALKNANLSIAQKGQKVTENATPELILGRSIHRMTLNGAASTLMQAKDNDRICIIPNPGATSYNDRFLIGITSNDNYPKLASAQHKQSIGLPLSFTYAPIWSQMLQEEFDAPAMRREDLVKAGLMKEVFTQNSKDGLPQFNFLAGKKVSFDVLPIKDKNGEYVEMTIDGIEFERLFTLENRRVTGLTKTEEKNWNKDVAELKEQVRLGTYVANPADNAPVDDVDGEQPIDEIEQPIDEIKEEIV